MKSICFIILKYKPVSSLKRDYFSFIPEFRNMNEYPEYKRKNTTRTIAPLYHLAKMNQAISAVVLDKL